MSIGRRLFDLLRANALHYLRGEDDGPAEGRWRPRRETGPEAGMPGEDPWQDPGAGARAASPASDRIRTAYRALELPYGAGPDAVRQAHRRLMRRYHPDRFARDTERLADATRLAQRLTEARDVLLEALERGEITQQA